MHTHTQSHTQHTYTLTHTYVLFLSRCSFQHDCSSSDWVSVPGTSQQREIISVHMKRSTNGQVEEAFLMYILSSVALFWLDFIMSLTVCGSVSCQDITVTAAPNLNSGIHFSCALEKCDSPGPSSCSCILSSESFPAEGLWMDTCLLITDTVTACWWLDYVHMDWSTDGVHVCRTQPKRQHYSPEGDAH